LVNNRESACAQRLHHRGRAAAPVTADDNYHSPPHSVGAPHRPQSWGGGGDHERRGQRKKAARMGGPLLVEVAGSAPACLASLSV
jgi:hypothetical protein